jgi:hypothetical protein
MSNLKYPLELAEKESDYMTFRSFEYRTNQKNLGNNGSGGNASGPSKGDTITLFMPTSTPATSNGNGWEQNNAMGPLESIKRSTATNVAGGILDLQTDNISSIVESFGKTVAGDIKNQGLPALRQFGIGAVGGYLGQTPNALLAMSKGLIYNPNIELLYQGPSMRGFNFTFIFAPKSKKEADIVNKIILEFKKWSSPQAKDGMFEVPVIWEINYMTGSGKNKNMNAFKRCACTNVSTQDNASLDYHMSYADGMPITTTMSLEFMEVDIITRQDHLDSGTNRGY